MMNLVNTLNLKQNMIANDTYTVTSDMFNFDVLFTGKFYDYAGYLYAFDRQSGS